MDMEQFDTVLIGSGYSSIGYAVGNKKTLIVEEQEIADTHFYLPLRSFRYTPYTPKTEDGAALDATFRSLGLFEGDKQNTNGFEPALCRYLDKNPVSLLLKARVALIEKTDDGQILTVSTNEGLLRISAKQVYDTRGTGEKSLTVLITAEDPADAVSAAEALGWELEDGFYPDWYALHIPDEGLDENRVKLAVHKALSAHTGIRILAFAPVYAKKSTAVLLCDDSYDNPIAAFEAGYLLGKEQAR